MSTSVATWPVFKTKLIERAEVAEATMAFRFERPHDWTFKAGQFIDITLLNPPETDAEGNVRGFSIASAPYEDTLMVVTRMRSTAFKRVLKTMPLESEVKLEGPFGNLRLHDNASRPAVLLAGGIGITPFRSMVLQAARDSLSHRIFLFYSNRRPEDAPFIEELCSLENLNPNYKFIPTMTEMEKSQQTWPGEIGAISHEMVSKYLRGVASPSLYTAGPIYYIAGPPAMVSSIRTLLVNGGVDEDDIRTEEFTGY